MKTIIVTILQAQGEDPSCFIHQVNDTRGFFHYECLRRIKEALNAVDSPGEIDIMSLRDDCLDIRSEKFSAYVGIHEYDPTIAEVIWIHADDFEVLPLDIAGWTSVVASIVLDANVTDYHRHQVGEYMWSQGDPIETTSGTIFLFKTHWFGQ